MAQRRRPGSRTFVDRLAPPSAAMMVRVLLLVPLELAIELVGKRIDGHVHVCMDGIGEQVAAG